MSLLLPILIFAVFYFLIIRPKQAKLRAAQQEQQSISEGDRVVTRAGIYGRVNRISQDLAVVEVAPGLELVFDKRSVLKAPENVDVDTQLSGEEYSSNFSDEDFTQLHDHLESHAGSPLQPESDDGIHESVDAVESDEAAVSNADDDERHQPGDDTKQ